MPLIIIAEGKKRYSRAGLRHNLARSRQDCELGFLEELSTHLTREAFAAEEPIPNTDESGEHRMCITVQVGASSRIISHHLASSDIISPPSPHHLPNISPQSPRDLQGLASRAGTIMVKGSYWGDILVASPLLRCS